MDWLQVIESLKLALDLTDLGIKVRDYFLINQAELKDPDVQEVIQNLPFNASPDEIISTLIPLYEEKAHLHFKAGNNNGGDLYIHNVQVEAGPGQGIRVSGGDGGPLGRGGNRRDHERIKTHSQ
ncbi:hypothetical protein [Polynucleobacter brandtiae]|uniref:Uncharacterized protein n=1 Tax=Polynucleobacter brandtiae TaxID=1938816 RepID=A0A2M8VR10_9BURK|nr:hypothetical protein [Polynucleobacter brandtiae]PJI79905.1 hypothetical protein B0G85_0886 [Polynucleobacter brandtiae]